MPDNSPRRIPAHLGIIPDGNRRWAQARGLSKEVGYAHGIAPGLALYDLARELGIAELSIYGFTKENTKRAKAQTIAFRDACVTVAEGLLGRDADLRVVGDTESDLFPDPLRPYATAERGHGKPPRVNLLVNYNWQWDLSRRAAERVAGDPFASLGSSGVSRIDLVVRWGGRSRLSGFLPVQCAYADLFVLESLWPDFDRQDLLSALAWYRAQDVTLGG